MEFIEWLKESWVILAAIASALILISNALKAFKSLTDDIKKPITEINDRLGKLEKDSDLKLNALLTLQRRSLLDACEFYLGRGYINMDERSTLNEQFLSYSDLGGNSFMADMVKRVNDLPVDRPIKRKIKNDKVVE